MRLVVALLIICLLSLTNCVATPTTTLQYTPLTPGAVATATFTFEVSAGSSIDVPTGKYLVIQLPPHRIHWNAEGWTVLTSAALGTHAPFRLNYDGITSTLNLAGPLNKITGPATVSFTLSNLRLPDQCAALGEHMVKVSDGSFSVKLTHTDTLTGCQAAPTIEITKGGQPVTGLTATEDTAVNLGTLGVNIQAADPSRNRKLRVTVSSQSGGTFKFDTTPSTDVKVYSSSGDNVSVYGTTAAIAAALAKVGFTPATDFSGAATLQVDANDLDFSGPGAAQKTTATFVVTFTNTDDPPKVTSPTLVLVDSTDTITVHTAATFPNSVTTSTASVLVKAHYGVVTLNNLQSLTATQQTQPNEKLVLLISDFNGDIGHMKTTLEAAGFPVQLVENTYDKAILSNPWFAKNDLSIYDTIVWSASGSAATGNQHTLKGDIDPLYDFVRGGGKLLITGANAITSFDSDDSVEGKKKRATLLIELVGGLGGSHEKYGDPSGSVINSDNPLTVGKTNIKGLTPTKFTTSGITQLDGLELPLAVGTVAVVPGLTGYASWTLRSLGLGYVSYVAQSQFDAWSTDAVYAGALKNFANYDVPLPNSNGGKVLRTYVKYEGTVTNIISALKDITYKTDIEVECAERLKDVIELMLEGVTPSGTKSATYQIPVSIVSEGLADDCETTGDMFIAIKPKEVYAGKLAYFQLGGIKGVNINTLGLGFATDVGCTQWTAGGEPRAVDKDEFRGGFAGFTLTTTGSYYACYTLSGVAKANNDDDSDTDAALWREAYFLPVPQKITVMGSAPAKTPMLGAANCEEYLELVNVGAQQYCGCFFENKNPKPFPPLHRRNLPVDMPNLFIVADRGPRIVNQGCCSSPTEVRESFAGNDDDTWGRCAAELAG